MTTLQRLVEDFAIAVGVALALITLSQGAWAVFG